MGIRTLIHRPPRPLSLLLFGRQGPPTGWNYARQDKNSYFIIFSSDMPKNKRIFFSKTAKIPIEFVYFYHNKSHTYFFFLQPESLAFIYFFPPTRHKAQSTWPNNITRVDLGKKIHWDFFKIVWLSVMYDSGYILVPTIPIPAFLKFLIPIPGKIIGFHSDSNSSQHLLIPILIPPIYHKII